MARAKGKKKRAPGALPEDAPPACPWPLRKLRQTYPRWIDGGGLQAMVYVCECGHELECVPGAEPADATRCEHCYWLGRLEQWNAAISSPLIRFDEEGRAEVAPWRRDPLRS